MRYRCTSRRNNPQRRLLRYHISYGSLPLSVLLRLCLVQKTRGGGRKFTSKKLYYLLSYYMLCMYEFINPKPKTHSAHYVFNWKSGRCEIYRDADHRENYRTKSRLTYFRQLPKTQLMVRGLYRASDFYPWHFVWRVIFVVNFFGVCFRKMNESFYIITKIKYLHYVFKHPVYRIRFSGTK